MADQDTPKECQQRPREDKVQPIGMKYLYGRSGETRVFPDSQ